MKSLVFYILFSNLCIQSISAFDGDNVKCCNNCSKEYFNRSIIYKFGISKTHSVIITENDTRCEVSVTDCNGNIITSECDTSPILQWAFEDMPKDLNKLHYLKVDDYDPLYYDLILSTQEEEIPVVSSTVQITGDKKIIKKINELKAFLIKLWTSTFEDP